eukprot:CAMPEP_0174966284 /NCGR_PEP_ID=MMETSP0004_2-20121128/6905_1 /TAXON_ID=420556 /ORGANISM="Ochromonas sp., Strain CCMP1393" /LENGTH=71 /DNA_ID=CAMNT_0016215213 /DNA_START=1747 /DNA_END=1958 /DNA_ORIENTATION=-
MYQSLELSMILEKTIYRQFVVIFLENLSCGLFYIFINVPGYVNFREGKAAFLNENPSLIKLCDDDTDAEYL